jgi:hypothetical protein
MIKLTDRDLLMQRFCVARALLLVINTMITKTKMVWGLFGISSLLVLASAARGYEEILVNNGAMIRGTVRVEGKVPKLPPLQITKFREVCRDVPNALRDIFAL